MVDSTKAPESAEQTEQTGSHATIDSTPVHGQTVVHQGTTYTTIKEGLAYILVPPQAQTFVDPKADKDGGITAQSVFYNPIQQFNRDLSVLAIRAYSEDFEARRQQRAEAKSVANKGRKERKKLQKQNGQAANGTSEAEPEPDAAAQQEAGEAADGTSEPGPEPNATALQEPRQTAVEDHVPTDAVASETKKRKADQDVDDDQQAKKQRLGATDAAPEQTEVAAPVIDPETAHTLPVTERPDNKLRKTMRILDALSATGLRALRYASEIPIPVTVTANDLLPAATDSIRLNVQHNKLSSQITTATSNAQAHMYNAAFGFSSHTYAKYDVIDLDPYGTAVPFLEAALLALNDHGLLCVTCTDAGVFNSMGYLEKTYALYGGIPIRGPHAHEGGLRLILHAIASTAAKHALHVEPLLSLSIDFYARVWVRVRHAPNEVKAQASQAMLVHGCDSGGCGAWAVQRVGRTSENLDRNGGVFTKYHAAQTSASELCAHCGSKTHLAGPMWGGPLHNPAFVARMLSFLPSASADTYGTKPRMEGMLTTALEELDVLPLPSVSAPLHGPIPALPPTTLDPHPFFVIPSALAATLKAQSPPEAAVKGALRRLGYAATRSHAKPGAVKTQAPWHVLWDVMRAWVAQRAPVKKERLREGGPGWKLLFGEGKAGGSAEEGSGEREASGEVKEEKEEYKEIVFDENLGKDAAEGGRRAKRIVRYQVAPRANWGPMRRATRKD